MSLKILEASTGIEPVYTDLQSAASPLRQLAFSSKIKYLPWCEGRFSSFHRGRPEYCRRFWAANQYLWAAGRNGS